MLQHVHSVLQSADLRFCQSEGTYAESGSMGSSGLRGAGPNDPRGYPAFRDGKFDIVSMASNHTMDWGQDALLETIEKMRADGSRTIGAGRDIVEARTPAIVEVNGTTIGFLGYCSVAPKSYYAVEGRTGVAPMRAITHYEPVEDDQPGTPCEILTWPLARDLEALVDDVEKLRRKVDVVVVSLHWGVHHIPALIADYQPVVAHAAIDAGADLILGHHAHIPKGVEVYNGKVIFYGIGNFALDFNEGRKPDVAWKEGVKAVYRKFGTPGPGEYRQKLEANFGLMIEVEFGDGLISDVGMRPVRINSNKEPVPVSASDPEGAEVIGYIEHISREAGLGASFEIDGEIARVKA
ncbi:MAG: CapA family protein [Mycobacterium sp.]